MTEAERLLAAWDRLDAMVDGLRQVLPTESDAALRRAQGAFGRHLVRALNSRPPPPDVDF